MEWWQVYLFTRLDSINTFFSVVFIGLAVCAGLFAIFGFMWLDTCGLKLKDVKPYAKIYFLVFVAVGAVSVLIPSQKEAAAIWLIPKLTHSEFIKEAGQIPTDAAKLLRLKLEGWINDTLAQPKK